MIRSIIVWIKDVIQTIYLLYLNSHLHLVVYKNNISLVIHTYSRIVLIYRNKKEKKGKKWTKASLHVQ